MSKNEVLLALVVGFLPLRITYYESKSNLIRIILFHAIYWRFSIIQINGNIYFLKLELPLILRLRDLAMAILEQLRNQRS